MLCVVRLGHNWSIDPPGKLHYTFFLSLKFSFNSRAIYQETPRPAWSLWRRLLCFDWGIWNCSSDDANVLTCHVSTLACDTWSDMIGIMYVTDFLVLVQSWEDLCNWWSFFVVMRALGHPPWSWCLVMIGECCLALWSQVGDDTNSAHHNLSCPWPCFILAHI